MEQLLHHWSGVEQQAENAGDDDLLNYATCKWEAAHKTWHVLQVQLREYNKNHS